MSRDGLSEPRLPSSSELQSEVSDPEDQDFTSRLKVQRKSLERLKGQYQLKCQQLNNADELIGRLSEENRQLCIFKFESEQLGLKLSRAESDIAQLRAEKAQLQRQLQAVNDIGLRGRLDSQVKENGQLSVQLDRLRIQKQKLQKQVSLLKIEKQDYRQESKAELNCLGIRMQTSLRQKEKLRQENQALGRRVQLLEKQKGEEMGRRQAAREAEQQLKEQLWRLEQKVAEKDRALLAQQQSMGGLAVQRHAQVSKLQSQLQRCHYQLRKAKAENQNSRVIFAEQDSILAALSDDNEELKRSVDTHTDLLRKASAELARLLDRLAESEDRRKEMEEEARACRDKLERANDCKERQRQQRVGLRLLRRQSQCEKENELRRMDELLSQIAVLH